MNFTKLLMAAAAACIIMFLLDGLLYMKVLSNFMNTHMTSPCDINRKEPMMLYIIAGELVLAFFMAYMYPRGVESNNKLMEGLKFGAIIGIIYIVPLDLIMYATTNMFSRMVIIADAGVGIVVKGIAGIAIAYIYGDAVAPKAK